MVKSNFCSDKHSLAKYTIWLLLALLVLATTVLSLAAQQPPPPSKFEIDRAREILNTVKDDVKKNYYDPAYHGMDLEARFKLSDEKLKQAGSQGQLWGIIAQTLIDLDDSHTFFVPPQKVARIDYGWQMQMVGNHCYVSAVKPGSDAEAKGIKPGDEVASIDGRVPDRNNLWLIQYLYYGLRPQPGLRLMLKPPDGAVRQVDAMARIRTGKQVTDLTGEDIWGVIREEQTEDRLHRHRYLESDDLLIWKMPQFDMERGQVDSLIDKAKKRKNLIIDMRGNEGGSEETLLRLIGNLIDHDVTLGELKRRKESKPLIAKTRGTGGFTGKLVLLVDSGSGSAAELLARIVQMEKRGAVIGDQTAGAVMRAKSYHHESGVDTVVFFGVSVTDADIIMTDGKSLEHVGVIPDEIKLPTAADLAAKRDPVLSYSASLLGISLNAEQAGGLFPVEWRK